MLLRLGKRGSALGARHISCGSSEAEGWSVFAESTTCSRSDDGFVECAGLFFFVGHFRIAECARVVNGCLNGFALRARFPAGLLFGSVDSSVGCERGILFFSQRSSCFRVVNGCLNGFALRAGFPAGLLFGGGNISDSYVDSFT